MLDVETRVVVQQKTSEIRTLMRRTAQDILDIGERLTEVKARLGHGRFGGWLQAEFAWEERAAQRFIAVYSRFKNDNLSDLNIAPSALYLLAAPSTPEEARADALEAAAAGQTITHAAAKQIVHQHKPMLTNGRRSGVNFAGEGVEPDLDEDGQPLSRRYGDEDEDDEHLRIGDVVRYGGQQFTLKSVASSGRVYFDVPKSHKLHGRGIESEDVLLIERKETPPPTPPRMPSSAWTGGEKAPSVAQPAPAAELRVGDKVITRTGHEGVITVADVGRHVVVKTVNGETIHERSTLTKVAPVAPGPLAEESALIDGVPVAETHPVGFALFYGGSGWATCVNCGESHPRWSPVRGGDWRCDKPNCKRLTHDDLMIEYTKADADAEQRQERRESAQRSAFRNAGQRVEEAPAPRQNGHAVHFSSDSPEWYTPPDIAALVREVMPINLDPASCYAAQQVIRADHYFDAQMNGLHPMRRWDGRVFLNPPYGREIGKWVERLISEYKAAHTVEAILLTPARPDTEWFGLLRDYPRCFVTGRLKFWTGNQPDDQQEAAPFPSAIFYLGNRFARFAEAFSTIGDIYTLWRPQS